MCNDKITSIKEILNIRESLKIAGDGTNIHAAVMMVIKNTDLLRNILTCLCEQDLDNNDFEVVLV